MRVVVCLFVEYPTAVVSFGSCVGSGLWGVILVLLGWKHAGVLYFDIGVSGK